MALQPRKSFSISKVIKIGSLSLAPVVGSVKGFGVAKVLVQKVPPAGEHSAVVVSPIGTVVIDCEGWRRTQAAETSRAGIKRKGLNANC